MILAKDCDYTDVTAVDYKKEAVLQSFVSGLEDSYVRQRILEKDVVNLENALESAEILKRAKTDAGCYEGEKYQSTVAAVNKLDFKSAVAAVDRSYSRDEESPEEGVDGKACFDQVAAVSKSNYSRTVKCHNCGFQHPAKQCPAVGKPVSVVGDETILQISVRNQGNHRSIHCWPHQKNRILGCAMLDFLNLRR